jgi:hypothetical protein
MLLSSPLPRVEGVGMTLRVLLLPGFAAPVTTVAAVVFVFVFVVVVVFAVVVVVVVVVRVVVVNGEWGVESGEWGVVVVVFVRDSHCLLCWNLHAGRVHAPRLKSRHTSSEVG